MEPTGEQLGPKINIAPQHEAAKFVRPYQELKERLGPQKYDAIIVFGEGPVKRVFFSDEFEKVKGLYKPEQIKLWEESSDYDEFRKLTDPKDKIKWLMTKGPRTKKDPDFTIVDISPHGPSSIKDTDINPNFERVKAIVEATDGKPEERKRMLEQFRTELENQGRHSYKRYGELNALAAGLMLYTGKTERLILSGGRTIPDDKIKQGLGFPSEAELMRDLIIRNFGQKMFERDNPDAVALSSSSNNEDVKEYNRRYRDYVTKTIHKYFVIEDSATNTIDNIVRSINHDPDTFFSKDKVPQIGLLGNNHQIKRCVTLLNLFTGNNEGAHPISAQNDILRPFADIRNKSGQKGFFPELLRYMTDDPTNIDLQDKTRGESVGQEKLEKPEDVFWWLGYISHSEVPEVFNAVMDKLKQSGWQEYSRQGFKRLGLDFDEFLNTEDFKDRPDLMDKLKDGFGKIIENGGGMRKEKVNVSINDIKRPPINERQAKLYKAHGLPTEPTLKELKPLVLEILKIKDRGLDPMIEAAVLILGRELNVTDSTEIQLLMSMAYDDPETLYNNLLLLSDIEMVKREAKK